MCMVGHALYVRLCIDLFLWNILWYRLRKLDVLQNPSHHFYVVSGIMLCFGPVQIQVLANAVRVI